MDIELREAYNTDWDEILELRNEFFQFFIEQKSPLSRESHYSYLEEKSKDLHFHHWMIICDQKIAGYVRIKENDIGIMVKKEFQNQGVGSIGLHLAEQKARELGIRKLVAFIREDNISSQKSFQKNDYELKILYYEKEL